MRRPIAQALLPQRPTSAGLPGLWNLIGASGSGRGNRSSSSRPNLGLAPAFTGNDGDVWPMKGGWQVVGTEQDTAECRHWRGRRSETGWWRIRERGWGRRSSVRTRRGGYEGLPDIGLDIRRPRREVPRRTSAANSAAFSSYDQADALWPQSSGHLGLKPAAAMSALVWGDGGDVLCGAVSRRG